MTASGTGDFHKELLATLPRLRVYALSLTHNRDAADDLLQETVAKALRARHSFQPGTNLAAWVFRILRNEFISELRKVRPTEDLDKAVDHCHRPRQEDGIVMREFKRAFSKLTKDQREALVLHVLDGQKLEDIGTLTGVAVGTVKSRISRARDALAKEMLGEERPRLAVRSKSRATVDGLSPTTDPRQ